MGYWEYLPIADQYGVPMAVTGFEPVDILQGILQTIQLLESGRVSVENSYARLVTEAGNRAAQQVIEQVFMPCDRSWRGIGLIPDSGWRLRPAYAAYDVEMRFDVAQIQPAESALCIAGQVLQGLKKPYQCSAFGSLCTPEHPLGATMVSSEGACAAYYRYKNFSERVG
jgi:hydrogenase expression/formation protein HypD